MRWVVPLLLVVTLSGCTQSVADMEPVRIVTYQADAPQAEDMYRFTLYGLPELEDGPRQVDFRFYWQNQLQWITNYDAEPGGHKERLEVLEIPAGELSFDVLVDGETVLRGSTDPSRCTSENSDAVARIMDPHPGDYGAIEIDIGCTP